MLATLGVKEGDESAGLAVVERGRRLGAALARTNEKVIEPGESPRHRRRPKPMMIAWWRLLNAKDGKDSA